MKCPNCGQENAEDAAECRNCQVIFRKLKERKAARPPEPSPAPQAENVAARSFPLPKILLVLAAAAAPAWFFLKPAAKPAAAPAAAVAARPVPAVNAGDQPPAAEPVPGAQRNLWKFEGTVLDLLKETPVEGAELSFYSNSGSETFGAVTNSLGRYSLELKPLERGGYGVFIKHPDYGNQHWDAAAAKKSLKERCRMGQVVQFMSPEELMRHAGGPGGMAIYDFAVYPNRQDKLTEPEREECRRGVSGR